jgi:hypothetical protein
MCDTLDWIRLDQIVNAFYGHVLGPTLSVN